jgi:hypothetical protein
MTLTEWLKTDEAKSVLDESILSKSNPRNIEFLRNRIRHVWDAAQANVETRADAEKAEATSPNKQSTP